MNETTTMLANTIKLILGDIPWVYSPQLSISDKIEELRKKNLERENSLDMMKMVKKHTNLENQRTKN